jgi:ankyrin repeat protein
MRRAMIFVAMLAMAAPGDTRLADAVQSGNRAAVRSLIAKKVAVNAPQGDGATALHWAAFNDDLESAKLLLAAGANVKAATRDGAITPLFMACRNGSAAMVELLLKAGAGANSASETGTTALMMAASAGNPEALKVLLAHGATVNARESAHGQTALIFAAALNRAKAIKVLLASGADPAITSNVTRTERVGFNADGLVQDDAVPKPVEAPVKEAAIPPPAAGRGERGAATMGGQTALLYAARDGQIDAARALVEGGADVNQGNAEEKTTPLVMAIINGHFDLAKILLDHGANPNLANVWGLAALYATIDVRWAPYAWFPQPITAQENVTHLELMKALIDRGADVNARLGKKIWVRSFGDRSWADPAGATPFWRAAQSDDVPAMKLLVARGADPKIASTGGDTALMVAAGLGWAPNNSTVAPDAWKAAVEYCLELGLDVNAADAKGYTALHGVAFRGDNDLVRFLVTRGAKTDVKTKAGDTIADMANGPIPHSIPHADTVALLEGLGSANSHNCRSDQCLVAPQADTGRGRGGRVRGGETPADAAAPAKLPVPPGPH